MEFDKTFVVHIAHPLVQVQMLYATRIKRTATAQNAMHLISFLNQELSQETAILTRNTCY